MTHSPIQPIRTASTHPQPTHLPAPPPAQPRRGCVARTLLSAILLRHPSASPALPTPHTPPSIRPQSPAPLSASPDRQFPAATLFSTAATPHAQSVSIAPPASEPIAPGDSPSGAQSPAQSSPRP